MHLFYCTNIDEGNAILSGEESGHCIRVLRLNKDDIVNLIDGTGNMFEAVITQPDPKKCQLRIRSKQYLPSPRNFSIHIAIAPTKNMDRFEWFVEKAVEIGIDIITPILCQHSERKVLKTDRLQKLIVSTMKQAKITKLPVLNELTGFNSFISSLPDSPINRFIAHCEESEKKSLKDAMVKRQDIIVLIGPEGDFSKDEIKQALNAGFIPVTLSHNRLRTETAGIVACNIVNLLNEVEII